MFNLIKVLFKRQIAAEVGRLVDVQLNYQQKQMVDKLCFLGFVLFQRSRRRKPGIKAAKNIVLDAQAIASVDAVVLPAIIRKALNNK